MKDLSINEIIEELKKKLESNNLKKIEQLEKQLERERQGYLKSLRYFKNKLKKGDK